MKDPRADLVIGREYTVVLEDCCIEGELRGKFVEVKKLVEDGEVYGYEYVFDFGWIGPEWGKWKATEVE